jgi:uncharacterized protein YcaQ
MQITLDHIRAKAVSHSLFTAGSPVDVVNRLGFVQVDPIQAPARAQDLILRHRVAGYTAGDLERHYPNAEIEEDVLHVYGFMPRATSRLMQPRRFESRIDREHPELAGRVMSFVQSHGATSHRDLEQQFGGLRTRGTWGNTAKVTTLVLDHLHYRGNLRVAVRKGNERFYTVAAWPQPALPCEDRLRKLVLLLMQLYAPLSLPALRNLISRLGYAAPDLAGRRTIIRRMVEQGELDQCEIDGMIYTWPAHMTFAAHETQADDEVRLLAPFDPIVYDRARFEHLWGWPYRFEAYTPVAKRKWGYYALPMLWRNRVVGWANARMNEGRLHVEPGFVGGRPADRAFNIAYKHELERLEIFLKA